MTTRKKPKIRVAIFQYDLTIGGVQKSLINILNKLDYDLFYIDLYIVDDKSFFESSLTKKIQVKKIKPFPVYFKMLPFSLVYALFSSRFKKFPSYDIAIDFNSYQHLTALGALTIPAKKRIMWFHDDNETRIKVDMAYRISYRLQQSKIKRFDQLVVVSSGLIDIASRLTGVPTSRIKMINNYINTDEIIKGSKENIEIAIDKKFYNLVSVCRLAHQKGLDITLDYMKDIIARRPDVRLYMVGGGPEKNKLEAMINDYGLKKHVFMLGPQSNPYKYMSKMDGFISTSRHEGQGMNILEAKVLGLEIFIPTHLEIFTYKIKPSSNIVDSIVEARRVRKKNDTLKAYNKAVLKEWQSLCAVNAR